jgi:hypothetical protein
MTRIVVMLVSSAEIESGVSEPGAWCETLLYIMSMTFLSTVKHSEHCPDGD